MFCYCFCFVALFCVFSGTLCHRRLALKNNNSLVTAKTAAAKLPSWSQAQLKEAISCILTQQMRFTQASAKFKIPKGTLYDNILGKTKRSRMLEEIGLSPKQEISVLEFACDVVMMPYNRRTSRPLISIVNYVKNIKRKNEPAFEFPIRTAFKWWWAFCKKHSIISLYYKEKRQNANVPVFQVEEQLAEKDSSPQTLWRHFHPHFLFYPLQTSPQNLSLSSPAIIE